MRNAYKFHRNALKRADLAWIREKNPSRNFSLANKMTMYNGEPCSICGNTVRYTSSRACVECVKRRHVPSHKKNVARREGFNMDIRRKIEDADIEKDDYYEI